MLNLLFAFGFNSTGIALALAGWLTPAFAARRSARLLLGVILGLLPCGLVYAALAITSTLPSPLAAALGMIDFGVGTLPALAALLAAQGWFPTRWRRSGPRVTATMLIAAGLLMLVRTFAG